MSEKIDTIVVKEDSKYGPMFAVYDRDHVDTDGKPLKLAKPIVKFGKKKAQAIHDNADELNDFVNKLGEWRE